VTQSLNDTNGKNHSARRFVAPAVVVIALAALYLSGATRYFSLQSIADHRATLSAFTSQHFALSLLAFMALYALAVAVSFPGASILTIVGGLLFGWFFGGVTSVIAATIGAVVVFQIAQSSFGNVLSHRAGPFMEKLRKGFEDDAFSYLLFLRLVPAFPFWLINIAPALAKVKLRTFAITTLLGIIPGTFAYAFVGAGLDSIISTQQAEQAKCIAAKSLAQCPLELSVSSVITPQLLLAFAALGVVALIPVALKKWKSRHAL
jgi:uncharacterized membrane protein YdjX (TVP38/TMEM64 family)